MANLSKTEIISLAEDLLHDAGVELPEGQSLALIKKGLSLDSLIERCRDKGLKIYDGDVVSEKSAAILMGYSGADTLRKQVIDQRCRIEAHKRGNRRFYFLKDILAEIPG